MKDGFAAAMRRATLLTRGGDVAGATRAIRTPWREGQNPARPTAARSDEASPPSRAADLRLVKPDTEAPGKPGSSNAAVGGG